MISFRKVLALFADASQAVIWPVAFGPMSDAIWSVLPPGAEHMSRICSDGEGWNHHDL
jgi:hypothetical protein